jgi:Na+/proline symporter
MTDFSSPLFETEWAAAAKQFISGVNPALAVAFVIVFLVGVFLPTIMAHFFNRENRKKIFLANIPAIISWVAWGTLVVAAFSHKKKAKNSLCDHLTV